MDELTLKLKTKGNWYVFLNDAPSINYHLRQVSQLKIYEIPSLNRSFEISYANSTDYELMFDGPKLIAIYFERILYD